MRGLPERRAEEGAMAEDGGPRAAREEEASQGA